MIPILLDLDGHHYGLPNPEENACQAGSIESGITYKEVVPSYNKFPRRELNLQLDERNDGNLKQ